MKDCFPEVESVLKYFAQVAVGGVTSFKFKLITKWKENGSTDGGLSLERKAVN